jgi:hypothetical protein
MEGATIVEEKTTRIVGIPMDVLWLKAMCSTYSMVLTGVWGT